jgi:hypothetical protein
MSNSLAIAAVTATLRGLLARAAQPLPGESVPDPLSDLTVSTKPPDRARTAESSNQINLFLYQTLPNAAFRNRDMPGRGRSGEDSPQPLALTLYYLITCYGVSNDEVLNHRILGRAMSLLHDRSTLLSSDIATALPNSGLDQQIERVRLTPVVLSWEEMSHIWSTLQTPYRTSVAYEASVVLIDSQKATHPSLPVLTLGGLERGAWPEPRQAPPFPLLMGLALPNGQPGLRLMAPGVPADILTVTGSQLAGTRVSARISSRLMTTPLTLEALPGRTDTSFQVQPSGDATPWHTGTLTLSAVVERAGSPPVVTSRLSFTLVPRLKSIAYTPPPPPPKGSPPGKPSITVTCTPPIRLQQRATLLLGNEELPAAPRTATTDTLSFPLEQPRAGTYWVRLRVDGVDSLLVDYSANPPAFDASQKVTVP